MHRGTGAVIGQDGWSSSGPAIEGPGATIQPVQNRDGVPHLALQFGPEFAQHPLLRQGMDPIAAFVREPSVEGVAPLAVWDRDRATFVYPSRDGVLLAAILSHCAVQGRPAGARAALELLMAVGPVLDAAARAGRRAGLPGHGALNPWRILVHPQGGATVLGHGVPAVEVATWLESKDDRTPGPGLAYFAPERIDEEDEDLRADLYALAATAAELALGRRLLSSDLDPTLLRGSELADRIRAGGAAAALQAGADPSWPPGVVGLLVQALAVDRSLRPASGRSMATRANELLRGSTGASIYDLASVLALPAGTEPLEDELTISSVIPVGAAFAARLSSPPAREEGDDDAPTVSAVVPNLSTGPRETVQQDFAVPRYPAVPSDEDVVSTDVIVLKALARESRTTDTDTDDADADRTEVIGIPADLRALRFHATRPPVSMPTMPAADHRVPPVEDLPRDAPLSDMQDQARRIVIRTRELAERALQACAVVVERAGTDPSLATVVRIARQAADRARRAADSAKSAAGLIELDEDAAGALITLDLVRNAELQCEGALSDVSTQSKELERVVERVQAQAKALADSARRASDHANRATDAANQADDLVTALERDQREGRLTAEGIILGIDDAIAAAERAHAAAEEARAHAELTRTALRADLALRNAEVARRAEDAAVKGLEETREAADRARRAEAEAKVTAVARASDRLASARVATEEANRALQRADDALTVATTKESRRQREACAVAVAKAQTAAREAEEAHGAARTAVSARDALGLAQATEEYAIHASAAALEAKVTSDRIVTLAGELAEAHARLSKLQEESRALMDRARAAVARVREEVERLRADAERLGSSEVGSGPGEAAGALGRAEEALARMASPAGRVASGADATEVVPLLEELRRLGADTTAAAEEARERVASARATVEAELGELRRRDEAKKAVAATAAEAFEHARRCRELVDRVWQIAQEVSPALLATDLDEAIRLRSKALEIIDIAEYQAGEAAASAELSAAETDPAEARAHAQTAQSFLERITADLPEAFEALGAADALARREVEALAQARARTAEIATQLSLTHAETRALVTALRTESAAWQDDEVVVAQLAAVEAAAAAFEEDLNESGWARDRAAAATTADDASEVVPNAEGALARSREKRRRLDAVVDTVRRAISAAELAAGAVVEARRTIRTQADGVASDLARLLGAHHRLKTSLSTHGATSEPVVTAETQLREAVAEVRRQHVELTALADRADATDSADEARLLAGQTAELLRSVGRSVERAAEAEARGLAAAEHESRTRSQAHQQRLLTLREDASAHARRAKEQVDRVDAALADVAVQGATGGEFARQRLDEVARLAELVRSQVGDVEQAAADAGTAGDATVVEALAERARSLAERIGSEAARVMIVVQEALDLARAAAVEAEALRSVRAEVGSAGEKANEAVERARAEAARIPSVVRDAPHIDVQVLTDEAAQHVQAAAKAAAKVKAAIPLTAQADAMPVAQSILRTARMALDRANASADAVRALIDRVSEQIRQEKEASARLLSDARARAAQPAQEATAAARKAEGWLEAGRREAAEVAGDATARSSLEVLERTVGEVRRLADEAVARATASESVTTLAEAQALAPEVRRSADQAVDASERARAALGALRERIATVRGGAEAAAAVAAEAAEQAAAASQVAEQGEATLRELEQIVDTATGMDESVMRALESVRTAATNARFAAATAGQAAERAKASRSRTEAEPAAEEAHSALEDALDALEKVVEAEQVCRLAIENRRAASAEEARIGESRRAREVQEKTRQQVAREEAEETERRRREDERKANFERRREERRPAESPRVSAAASDRETLRERLRQSRPNTETPGDPAARPRRRGDTSEERNETQPGFPPEHTSPTGPTQGPRADSPSGRNVRSWTPGQKAPGTRPIDPRADRPTGAGQTGVRPAAARPTATRPTDARPTDARPTGARPIPPRPVAHRPGDEAIDDTEPRENGRTPEGVPRALPPVLGRTSDSPKVDALLERLRARRSEKD